MKAVKFSVIIIAFAILLVSFDDVPQLNALLQKLSTYNSKYPEEKVYVHLDKPFYKPGESIWFSVYALNGVTHQPSAMSNRVHVKLVDPKGNVIEEPELYLKDGVSYGDFQLKSTAPGGVYKLKAYTKWNLNFKNQELFEKEIQVQQISTPRLLLKLDWEKEAYGAGDSAVARITVRNLKDEKIHRAEVNYKAFVAGHEIAMGKVFTQSTGIAKVKFRVPVSITSTDGLLQALVSDNGIEESISRSVPIVLNKISLQFFPEGGDMIAGTETKIAFKALNEFGKAADVEGEIVRDNQVITGFSSYHMGMGAFDLKPTTGKYFARITRPAGIKEIFPLPDVLIKGYSLNLVDRAKENLTFLVQSPSGEKERVFLVCTVHGQSVWQKAIDLKPGVNSIKIDSRDPAFISGIGVFTLFDQAGNERCERLTYINKDRQLNIHLETKKDTYQPGEKVELDIKTTDNHGSPVPARLSLAVVDDQLLSFADDKQDNILSWFLLSSEVKGDVQEPSFYFDPTEGKADRALDYLLMTQGWRRFSWKTLSDNLPIAYMPEKEGTISGYTANGTLREKTRITLVEMGNKRRVIQTETRGDGSFDFVNTDPTVPSMIIAKRPHLIFTYDRPGKQSPTETTPSKKKKPVERSEEFDAQAQATEDPVEIGESIGNDFSMAQDVASLQELIVVGYGVEESANNSYGCSISVIRQVDEIKVLPLVGVESMLSGRVAGIQISRQNGMPASSPNVRLRGITSISGNSQPLYVIDGVPVSESVNPNFSAASIISTDDIATICAFYAPDTPTLFGNRAINGAITISTNNGPTIGDKGYYSNEKKKSHFNYVIVPPRRFATGREFYVPLVAKKKEDERVDFRTTVFWNQHIVTDKNGKATISFKNNDNTSVFRITAEGITSNGLIGHKETTYSTQIPFSVDMKLPEFLGFEDTLRLPVRITNALSKSMQATIKVNIPDGLIALPSNTIEVEATAATTSTAYVTILSNSKAGTFPMSIEVSSENFHDEIKHKIAVHPVGFPVIRTWSSSEADKTMDVDIRDAEKGSMKGRFEAYSGMLGSLMSDAKAMLRQPHGCFEQVSSSTFPNILALQYMQKIGKTDKNIEDLALNYIRDGYRQLMAYEIKGGGFEWFGNPPAHEALSAFGMIEFYEMQKVFSKVDPDVVSRTAKWLLSRRDNNGGFRQNHGKYGFSSAPENVNNAYIVYALAETGQTGFEKEYSHALNEAIESKDLYRRALVAIASYELNKMEDYQSLIDHFKEQLEEETLNSIQADASIVYSGGQALKNETIAFWILAMAKQWDHNLAAINQCVKYIVEHRQSYGFGSTQTTTVCLQALCAFVDIAKSDPGNGTISILVNNIEADVARFGENTLDVISMNAFVGKLASNGTQPLRVKFYGKGAMPWQLQLEWYSKKPANCESCKLGINTEMSGSVKVNETVRLTTTLTNKTKQGLPMSMVVIGIPGGLSVQPWQLKELQEKGVFDFYEIIGDRLAIYYRELAPSAVITINLDLKAELPGSYRGAASTAYLYYTDECKQWADGVAVTVAK